MNIPTSLDATVIFAGLSYLLLFRLAIIALGSLCIFLGYRLFSRPLPNKSAEQTPELSAKFGDKELLLRSVGPGVFFAGFGALITVSVLFGNAPEFILKDKQGEQQTALTMRSDGDLPSTVAATQALLLAQQEKAQTLAQHALKLSATPQEKAEALSILASFAFAVGKVDEAINYQSQALAALPDNHILQKRLAAYQLAK